jgi:hypothetical protein
MSIILNSDILNELIISKKLKIIKKYQKNSENSNYYFTPSLGINLYKPKIIFIKPSFVVLEFDKYEFYNLLKLLQNINDKLQNKLKNEYSELFNKDIYNIVSEQENSFTLRCHLPNKNGKYFIKCNESTIGFKLPKINSYLDSVLVEIRNVWCYDSKYGFNVELKSINY